MENEKQTSAVSGESQQQDLSSAPPQQKPAQSQQERTGAAPHRGSRRPDPRHHRQPRTNDQRSHEQRGGDGSAEVSIVIPLYNEEQSLRELHEQIRKALQRSGTYEILFIDDGSTDGSTRVIHELRRQDKRVKLIRFRRNYGKSAALSVGFQHARGSYIVTMDADLQDDPNEIPNLIHEIKKGFDLVSGWKKKRFDPITKTIPSRLFNFVTSLLTGISLHDFNCGLKAYRREVVKEVKIYGELHRFIPALAHWNGFKIGEIPVQHRPRKYGKTKFGIGRFWRGFLDLLTVLFTTRYLRRPLHLFGFWGIIFFLAGFTIDLYLTVLKFMEGESLSNRPLFFGGVLLIIVGVQFVSIGLIGEMISKTMKSSEEEYSLREIWK